MLPWVFIIYNVSSQQAIQEHPQKILAFLYKLEKATTELAVLNRQVIDLTNECRELWLPK